MEKLDKNTPTFSVYKKDDFSFIIMKRKIDQDGLPELSVFKKGSFWFYCVKDLKGKVLMVSEQKWKTKKGAENGAGRALPLLKHFAFIKP